ncbi:hypothetical protein FRC01_003301, partial [Tulasnella sp. 417]
MSALSAITELTFSWGTVRRENLTKLEELGIEYSLYSIKYDLICLCVVITYVEVSTVKSTPITLFHCVNENLSKDNRPFSPALLSTVKDCDDLLAKYENTGQKQHTSFVIQIKRRRNAMLPIARLPRELRDQVFNLSLPHRRVGRTGQYEDPLRKPTTLSFRYYLALFTLRQVSCCWDQDICTAPSFWTVMSYLFLTPFQELIWRRSGNMPLDAEVARGFHWLPQANLWSEEEIAYLERVMQRGVRELYILEVPIGEDPSPYITNIHHPRLSKLHIHCRRSFEFSSPLVAPQLTDIYLVRSSLPWDSMTRLRSLILRGSICPTLLQLVQALTASPSLEELQLAVPRDVPPTQLLQGDVTQRPLNMTCLTAVRLELVPCELTASLLDCLVASPYCRAWVEVDVMGYPHVPILCQQIGRLCRSLGDAGKELNPDLSINLTSIQVRMGDKAELAIQNHAWSEEEDDAGFSRGFQLAKLFLAEIEGPRFKESIKKAVLWSAVPRSPTDGIEILDHFFPKTCCLNISGYSVLPGLVRALAETEGGTGGFPQWHLQKLSELEIKLYDQTDTTYDGLMEIVIKRTQAAALPQST